MLCDLWARAFKIPSGSSWLVNCYSHDTESGKRLCLILGNVSVSGGHPIEASLLALGVWAQMQPFLNRFLSSMPLEDVVALSDEGEASQPEAAASDDAAALADELITKGKPASKPKQKAKAKATPKKVTTTKKDEAKPGGAGKVLKKPSVKRPASSTSSTKPPTRAYKSMYKNGVWGIKYGGPEVIRVPRQHWESLHNTVQELSNCMVSVRALTIGLRPSFQVKPHEGVPPEKLEEIAAWAPAMSEFNPLPCSLAPSCRNS